MSSRLHDGETAMVIGILDHMGYGNLGDAATQDAAIASIKKRLPKTALVGFSFIPHDTTGRHGIPSYPIRWSYPATTKSGDSTTEAVNRTTKLKSVLKNTPLIYSWAKPLHDFLRETVFWFRSYRIVRRLDVLIISGGGQLCDLWHGPWSHPYTILKFCLLTKLAGRKLYFLNVGAGPLDHSLSRLFARWSVELADYRSFRDSDSEKLVRSIGVKGELHVYPDLAYALDEPPNRIKVASPTPIVGVNPIGFCDPRIWPRKDAAAYETYLDKIFQFSLWLLDRGYKPQIFTTEVSVDKYAIEELRDRLRPRVTTQVLSQMFRPPATSVNDVLQEMSDFDFVVTSKYHGLIFSHLLGKPVISLSYHRKMDFVMQAVGQSRFRANIEDFDLAWLTDAFGLLTSQSEIVKAQSAEAVKVYAGKLSQQFDDLFVPNKLSTSTAHGSSLIVSS